MYVDRTVDTDAERRLEQRFAELAAVAESNTFATLTARKVPATKGPHWRVSQDVSDFLIRWAHRDGFPAKFDRVSRVLGYPLAVDESLPPNSVLFETTTA